MTQAEAERLALRIATEAVRRTIAAELDRLESAGLTEAEARERVNVNAEAFGTMAEGARLRALALLTAPETRHMAH